MMNKTSKNESGIQQVFDMNTNGDLSVGIKVDYLVDSIRGLKTMVSILMFICFILCAGMVYIVLDNKRTSDNVEYTLDTISKRHYILSKEFKQRDE